MEKFKIVHQELLSKFKVEELKQRIEFDISLDEASSEEAWKEQKTSVGTKVEPGKPPIFGFTHTWTW